MAQDPAPLFKKLTIHLAHEADASFDVAMYPGTSDRALRSAVAARARLPAVWKDGSESFYLTQGSSESMVVPLCADGIPDGTSVTLHMNPPPSTGAGEEVWPPSGSAAFTQQEAPSLVPTVTTRAQRASLAADATMRTARASLAERLNTDTDTATQKFTQKNTPA